jgi:tetratricopeptide (TPR) repeat protein
MTRLRPEAAVWLALVGLAALLSLAAGCNQSPGALGRADPLTEDEAFQRGTNRPPTLQTRHALARLLADQGKDEESEAVLRQLLAEWPGFVNAYCDLAELQMRQGRADDAIRTLSVGLGRAPKDPVLLNNLGVCWLFKNDLGRALQMFTAAAAVAPSNARYRANMAMAMGLQGRYEESLALYEQVLPPAEAHSNLAVLCRARGDEVRAAKESASAKILAESP